MEFTPLSPPPIGSSVYYTDASGETSGTYTVVENDDYAMGEMLGIEGAQGTILWANAKQLTRGTLPLAPEEKLLVLQEDIKAAIGYQPVLVSLREGQTGGYTHRTAEDRDWLVEEIAKQLFAAGYRK